MKIAYISVCKDGTGYAHQAVNNMLALESAGLDVVSRSVSLSQTTNRDLAKKVLHLEDKSVDNVEVVIQHILPNFFEYKYGVKNIGIFDWETTHFRRSNWPHCCNIMDEIWVPSIQNTQAAKNSGVKVPIRKMPCACDTSKFNADTKPLQIPKLSNKCVFYTIGEMSRRKNIIATIRAFYSAFTLRDDVVLVIKANIPGKSPEETMGIIKETIADIKKSIHIYARHSYYPPVACITDFLPDEKINQLHKTGDVFVSASHGEAWGIPAHDALGFGNPAILSNWGSSPELLSSSAIASWRPTTNRFSNDNVADGGWLVNGQLTPCFGHTESYPDLYTGDEYWFEPDICHFISCMKQAYEKWQNGSLAAVGQMARHRAFKYSYEKVGLIAKNLLEL